MTTGRREGGVADRSGEVFDDLPHTHLALDDAVEQGALFCTMLRASGGG